MRCEMYNSYYEYEKCHNNIYDQIREYCICERVNEEHLRSLITSSFGKKKPVERFQRFFRGVYKKFFSPT